MCRARGKVIAFILTFALAVFFSAPAAALRLGPAILGIATLPLRIITGTHGGGHHHVARVQAAHASVESARHAPGDRSRLVENHPPSTPAPAPANSASAPSTAEAHADVKPVPAPPRAAGLAPAWPIASPSVYEDLLGYILWPGEYADHLWTHGYGDVMNTLLTPATTAPEGSEGAASLIADGMCSVKATELADQLIAHTRKAIAPTEAQAAALDELAAALREAIARGRAAVCAGGGDPVRRMADGLWTMWDATLLMRPPLEKFYNSLTDAQKEKLKGRASEALRRACAEQRPEASLPSARSRASSDALGGGGKGRGPLPPRAAQLPTPQELQQRSAALTKLLAASCPQGGEETPIDRLQAAGERMNALLYVVMSMAPVARTQAP